MSSVLFLSFFSGLCWRSTAWEPVGVRPEKRGGSISDILSRCLCLILKVLYTPTGLNILRDLFWVSSRKYRHSLSSTQPVNV